MKKYLFLKAILLSIGTWASYSSVAQTTVNDPAGFKTIPAGPQYERSGFYQFLWGRNYRKEWITPVRLPILHIDTLRGGLISFKESGSNQSQSIQLKTAGNKEYALRSVDKRLDKVIPEIFQGTFAADIANDEISMSNPYGALGVPVMAEAIGMKHTNPKYYYLPEQKVLDTLNKKYAGKVYLLEQRPKGNWSEADNLGNFKDFEDSEDLLPKILKNQDHSIDQHAFARARLFDMLIGDYDRHADQWKWGVKKENGKTIYVPVPTDRDQAFSTRNGFLLNLVIRLATLKMIQSYNHEVDNIRGLLTINRVVDRLATNKMTLPEWQAIATDIQAKLTDNVIEESVKQMPPEIYPIRGNELVSKLKSRRNRLSEYVTIYYKLLAEEAEVVGTIKDEFFEVSHLPNNTTEVKMYGLTKNRQRESNPFYSRIFSGNETDEVRLYGIDGNDIFRITGPSQEINIRVIGGNDRDSIIDESVGSKKVHIYDNNDNYFMKGHHTKMHLSEDSAVHVYDYNSFLQDKRGLLPHLIYNDPDRIFLGLRYYILNHRWRKRPFAYKQSIDVDYSITQKAMSTTYNGLFPGLFGKWDLVAKANYDWIRWTNFHGLGNETPNITRDRDYYRMRTEEGSADLGIRLLTGKHNLKIGGFFQRVKIINDSARYVSKTLSNVPGIFDADNFAGGQITYDLAIVKDSILPRSGITLSLGAKHTQNLNGSDGSYQLYTGKVQFFIPLIPKFSLAIKAGGQTITGTPLFYQFPSIGQSFDLRGFRRERFSGESTFYNNNELRFVTKVRSYIFNGKAGVFAFVDNGRVWMPGEDSDKIHTTYGGGILLAPFNLMSAAITYGVSDELKMLQFRVGVLF